MMKKLLSINLSLALMISLFNLKTNALVPTNFEDLSCINLSNLGVGVDFISYNGTRNAVCGCKTCNVDAMLYGKIGGYIKSLKQLIFPISKIAKANNQDKVDSEVKKLTALNLAYIAPPLFALLKPINPYVKTAFFIVEAGGAIIGLLYKVSETQYETMFFENKAKLDNINAVLHQISEDIENGRFKNRNFLLVSTNYNPTSAGAVAQFAKKDGIGNDDKYNEEYFNKLNEEEIKPVLREIDRQVFPAYDNVEYNKEVRDILKTAKSVTLPTAVLSDAYLLLTGQGINIARFVRDYKPLIALLGTGFWGALYAFFSGEGTGNDTGKKLNDIAEKGVKTLKIIYDDDHNQVDFESLRQSDRGDSESL